MTVQVRAATISSVSAARTTPGVVLLVLGATCNAIGVGLAVAPREEQDFGAGMFWIVVSVIAMMVPGLLLVISGRRRAASAARIEKIVALARASERVPITSLARELGVEARVARDALLEAIARQRVVGRIDLEAGVFISGSTEDGNVRQVQLICRSCGARSSVVVTPSSITSCPYCGFRLA